MTLDQDLVGSSHLRSTGLNSDILCFVATSTQITGSFKAHAPESSDGGSSTGSPKAALDMLTAYTTASQPASSDSLLSGLASPYALTYTNPWGGQIPAGAIFKPGVYNWGSTVVIPVSAHVIIEGGISDIFIFVSNLSLL